MKNSYIKLQNAKRIVVKIGTSTLTYETGRLNIRRIESIAQVLSDLKHQGREICLVSSGAISAGIGKIGLTAKPDSTAGKQAIASIGQCELMYLYDKLFSEYGQIVSQLLLTRDVMNDCHIKENVINTFNTLFDYDVIPIVNENDTVSYDEILYGDNDTLSAVVAKLIDADLLILLSDIDGLYDKNPSVYDDAKLIHTVDEITDEIKKMAGSSGTNRGTGGMITKLSAAELANSCGIPMIIANGKDPHILYNILDGENVGTLFKGKE